MPWVGHGITDCTGILNANTVILIGAKFIILKVRITKQSIIKVTAL